MLHGELGGPFTEFRSMPARALQARGKDARGAPRHGLPLARVPWWKAREEGS